MMIQVETTSDRREALVKIADLLIERGLAACCQIEGPVTSVYRWQGKTESSSEFRCVIKSIATKFEAICQLVREQHHYEVPQLIAIKVPHCDPDYLNWVQQQVGQSDS